MPFRFFMSTFVLEKRKLNIMEIFDLTPKKGTRTLRMGDSDELVLADCFMRLVEQRDGCIRRVNEFATNM